MYRPRIVYYYFFVLPFLAQQLSTSLTLSYVFQFQFVSHIFKATTRILAHPLTVNSPLWLSNLDHRKAVSLCYYLRRGHDWQGEDVETGRSRYAATSASSGVCIVTIIYMGTCMRLFLFSNNDRDGHVHFHSTPNAMSGEGKSRTGDKCRRASFRLPPRRTARFLIRCWEGTRIWSHSVATGYTHNTIASSFGRISRLCQAPILTESHGSNCLCASKTWS